MPGSTLSRALILAAPEPLRAELRDDANLESSLISMLADVRAKWPDFEVDDDEFVAHIGARLSDDAAFDGLHFADLYLAHACSRGDTSAVAAFEHAFGGEIDAGLRRLERKEAGADDLGQQIREKLLVGTSERNAKISEFSGRGALLHWLRVAVVRMRADVARKNKRTAARDQHPDPGGAELPTPGDDPEIAYLRGHYRELLLAAFEDAAAALAARERTVLRQYTVEGLTSDQIAKLYGVHRATAKRWLAKARETLWRETKRGVMLRLGLGRTEFESIVRLVRSELDVSINRVLRTRSG